MSGAVSLEEMEAAARVCAADMWTLRAVWDAYGLWFNAISLDGFFLFSEREEKSRRETAIMCWHEYVMQERAKRKLN